jgi:hypothetical protein
MKYIRGASGLLLSTFPWRLMKGIKIIFPDENFTLPCTVDACKEVVGDEGKSRSQRSRGLKYELSSPVQTLRSWVQFPLEARIYVCVYSLFTLSSVKLEAL